jgi:hypothetical protein
MDAHIAAIEAERKAAHDHTTQQHQVAGQVLGVISAAHAHDTSMAQRQQAHEHSQKQAEGKGDDQS